LPPPHIIYNKIIIYLDNGGRGLVNIHRLQGTQKRNTRNELRSIEECLTRLAVQADKGYTPLKLNDQNVEDDVTITPVHLENKNPTMKIPKVSTGKTHGQRVLPIVTSHRLYPS
jgi:hypothetical protein